MHASEDRKNALNTQIKKIEEVLNAKRKDHSHATAQREQHADNIKFTQKALLDVKKQAPARRQLKPPLPIPADFLQTAKELQNDAHMQQSASVTISWNVVRRDGGQRQSVESWSL